MRSTLRPADPCDAPDIVNLRDRIARWMVDRGIRQWSPGEYPIATAADEAARGEWFVARDEAGCLAATVRLIWSDPRFWGDADAPAGYVHGLMVATASTVRGRDVLDFAAERTLERGLDRLRLDVVGHNDVLVRFYADYGFTEVGRARLPHPFPDYEIALMEKPLSP
ncbi:GNAT family N-acetyltransferase [Tsukamurella sp. 8F]|uniref:GNAT family N-acetyltransferase n=1 Tax=unclassified Tsukamurella TaxID=2633480 RepID=UPI0023B998B2|nr:MULTISPECIES: GNAT family N-acetyltransferase [unclassified Tsukamurella]MDF0528854.1 GNAT family N-acetyltransferase [Tsukamurella sp. 8J]MDF0586689.1 GNAT family N-acetyltransferase [Tsukamurella sp. 8F]